MRTKPLHAALPYVAMVAAGVAIFFVVRLLLPTGEEALPPFVPVIDEPPPPVFTVRVPRPSAAGDARSAAAGPESTDDVVVVVAEPVSQPVAVHRFASAAKPKPAPKAKARAESKPKPAPTPAPAPAPAPVPVAAEPPKPEPSRVLARAAAERPNRSPGRAKHDKGPPPGHTKKEEMPVAPPPSLQPVTAGELPAPPYAASPGREKHGKGLPPGLAKRD